MELKLSSGWLKLKCIIVDVALVLSEIVLIETRPPKQSSSCNQDLKVRVKTKILCCLRWSLGSRWDQVNHKSSIKKGHFQDYGFNETYLPSALLIKENISIGTVIHFCWLWSSLAQFTSPALSRELKHKCNINHRPLFIWTFEFCKTTRILKSALGLNMALDIYDVVLWVIHSDSVIRFCSFKRI